MNRLIGKLLLTGAIVAAVLATGATQANAWWGCCRPLACAVLRQLLVAVLLCGLLPAVCVGLLRGMALWLPSLVVRSLWVVMWIELLRSSV